MRGDVTMDQKMIENLFFEQMKNLTQESLEKSYDYQFSDAWLDKALSENEYERSLCSLRGA